MSTTTDGWTGKLGGLWAHGDGSLIVRLDEPFHGPLRGWFALYVGDPPAWLCNYREVDEAKRAYDEYVADRAEARELRRSKT